MPFPNSRAYPISNKDVVSFTFDDPEYDLDKPLLLLSTDIDVNEEGLDVGNYGSLFINPDDPKEHYTYRQSRTLVRQLIAGLRASGLQPGDTVCIHSFNSLLYPLLILAIIGAGGLSVGTNPSYTAIELSHAIRVAEIKFVLAEPEILPNITTALQENKIDLGSRLFILDTPATQPCPSNHRSWRALLSHGEYDWIRFNDEKIQTDTVAQLYYTSGTTGLPKCAMTTHRNLVAEHILFFGVNPRSYPIKLVLAMPFFHVGIAPQVFVSVLREGREAYVMRRFDLKPYLSYHAKYKLTEVFTVPPMIVGMVMSGLADENSKTYDPQYSLRTVRNGTVGAAPCSADMQARFHALLGKGATFSQVWGMTESTTMANIVPWSIARAAGSGALPGAWGTIGVPLPNWTMKLIDEHGHDVTGSGKGELCIKGPGVVKGYYRNEAATKSSWDSEGFFRTGDVIEVRPHKDPETGETHQLMFIVERLKELIKVRGFQVAPAELEGALTEHPDIVDAAVIGLPGKEADADELPKAYVVRREGSTLSTEDVMGHMKARLARYKQLEGGVEFVESIPKLPSGKILKRVLREEARQKGRREGGASKL